MQNSKKPFNPHLIAENTTYGLYFVDSSDRSILLKTTDEGVTVSQVYQKAANADIISIYHNRTNNFLRLYINIPAILYCVNIDLSDDSNDDDSVTNSQAADILGDIIQPSDGDNVYLAQIFDGANINLRFNKWVLSTSTNTTYTKDKGSKTGRQADGADYVVEIGSYVWYLWNWSNENVELWKWEIDTNNYTEMEDCGSTTELPLKEQRGMVYDGSDIIYFILGTGTKEVSTIVADVPANIDDGDYITYSAMDIDPDTGIRSETDYYIWFDKVGDDSGDPAPASKTEIRVDISGAADAQDVSDATQSAIDAISIITAANGGGTSTTVTITNHHNGNVTNIADVDSGLSVATTTPGVDNTNYLYSYVISTDTLTKGSAFDIVLMLDRNCIGTTNSPYEMEKAYHISSSLIYQFHRDYSYILKIQDLELASGETIIAITDTYLITSNSDLYEHTNYFNKIPNNSGFYGINNIPKLQMSYYQSLSTDTVFILYQYDDDDSEWDNVCFIGKVGLPRYEANLYHFDMVNLGYDDWIREVTDSASAEDIATTFRNQIDDNSFPARGEHG